MYAYRPSLGSATNVTSLLEQRLSLSQTFWGGFCQMYQPIFISLDPERESNGHNPAACCYLSQTADRGPLRGPI